MKRTISVFLILLLVVQSSYLNVFAATKYPVIKCNVHTLGGSSIADLIVVNDQIMVDFNDLAFYLRAETGTISAVPFLKQNGHTVVIASGTTSATVDKTKIQMPAASFTQDNRLYVPLNFVVESIGYMSYFRKQNQTIYIQNPENYQKAQNILNKSLEVIKTKTNITTTFKNYTNLSSDEPERYFVEGIGTIQTSLKNNIAHTNSIDTVYNGYYDSVERNPVQTYVDPDPVDSWKIFDYVTSNGIYTLDSKENFIKESVPPENISTMDMASKSAQIDKDLYLYSARIDEDDNGNISVKAETDVGLLVKVGFDIFMPKETNSLKWSETYQTVIYDPKTYLPIQMDLYLNSNYIDKSLGKVYLEYMHKYNFDFNKTFDIKLPEGVN